MRVLLTKKRNLFAKSEILDFFLLVLESVMRFLIYFFSAFLSVNAYAVSVQITSHSKSEVLIRIHPNMAYNADCIITADTLKNDGSPLFNTNFHFTNIPGNTQSERIFFNTHRLGRYIAQCRESQVSVVFRQRKAQEERFRQQQLERERINKLKSQTQQNQSLKINNQPKNNQNNSYSSQNTTDNENLILKQQRAQMEAQMQAQREQQANAYAQEQNLLNIQRQIQQQNQILRQSQAAANRAADAQALTTIGTAAIQAYMSASAEQQLKRERDAAVAAQRAAERAQLQREENQRLQRLRDQAAKSAEVNPWGVR